MVKIGGPFASQDLFSIEPMYGKMDVLLATILSWGISRVEFVETRNEPFIPTALKLLFMVGPENAAAFAAYFQNKSLPFVGLPDPKASVLKLYGQEVNLFKLGRMPAQVLIDKAGMARFVHYGHSMSDIPSNPEILGLVDEINQKVEA